MKKKLKKIKLSSGFEKLTESQMLKLTGGNSCSGTGSSAPCDATAICNCNISCAVGDA